jgi:transcriptional regulator with XRE-family HTH domain
MPELREKFGERLRELRKRAGFSAESLAEAAGAHPNTVYVIERGEQWIGAELLETFARLIKVEPAALFSEQPLKPLEPTPEEALAVLRSFVKHARAREKPSSRAPSLREVDVSHLPPSFLRQLARINADWPEFRTIAGIVEDTVESRDVSEQRKESPRKDRKAT